MVNVLTINDVTTEQEKPGAEDLPEAGGDRATLLVYNVLRTHAALSPFVERGLRELNLTGAQLNTLLVLRDAGTEGIPLSEVGRRLVVTKANMTGLIDRLEREGLVRRESHSDRRVTLARLTEQGVALLETALPRRERLLAELLDFLGEEEAEQLIGLLSKVRAGLRAKKRREEGS